MCFFSAIAPPSGGSGSIVAPEVLAEFRTSPENGNPPTMYAYTNLHLTYSNSNKEKKQSWEKEKKKKKMLKSRKGCGIYRDTLNREARDRYVDKIGTIEGLDPYELPNKDWSTDEDLLPQFCIRHLRLPCLWCERLHFGTVPKLQIIGVTCTVHKWMGSGADQKDQKAGKQ